MSYSTSNSESELKMDIQCPNEIVSPMDIDTQFAIDLANQIEEERLIQHLKENNPTLTQVWNQRSGKHKSPLQKRKTKPKKRKLHKNKLTKYYRGTYFEIPKCAHGDLIKKQFVQEGKNKGKFYWQCHKKICKKIILHSTWITIRRKITT